MTENCAFWRTGTGGFASPSTWLKACGLLVLLLAASPVSAQVIPVDYRVTRTSPDQPTVVHVFPKASMTCNLSVLPVEQMLPQTLRITDPERPARDCEAGGTVVAPIFAGIPVGSENLYAMTVAGRHNAIDGFGPESNQTNPPRTPLIPGAPTNPRVRPPASAQASVVVNGVIQDRYPFAGIDVASIWLDQGAWLYVGAQTLSTPGYTVQRGDKVELALYR